MKIEKEINEKKFEMDVRGEEIFLNGKQYWSVEKIAREFKLPKMHVYTWISRAKPKKVRYRRLYVAIEDFLKKYIGIEI